jgi:putative nucleotidyltransferase with HDIG domain
MADWSHIAVLASLCVLTSFLPLRLPNKHITNSPMFPIIFATIALYGATAGLVVSLLSVFAVGYVAMPRVRRLRLSSYLPNAFMLFFAVGSSALPYLLLSGTLLSRSGVRSDRLPDWRGWIALPLCSLLGFVLNSLLTTTLVSRHTNQRWDIIWHNNFRWMMTSALVMSPIGLLTAVLYSERWWLGIGFILLPMYAQRMVVVTHERTLAAYKQGVELLGRVMQEAHPYTHGHLHRVAHWAKRIAEEMNLPASSMEHIEDAAILHDIGKVAVDDRVLNKIGKLTDSDWDMIRRHPVTGSDLVMQMTVLNQVGYWIRHHHERPDGKGYPDGLGGESIPVESAIISVVDAYDAMVGGPAKEDQRPYRKPMSREAAMQELQRHAGTQFQADVVATFLGILQSEPEHLAPQAGRTPDMADDSLWVAPPETLGVLIAGRS